MEQDASTSKHRGGPLASNMVLKWARASTTCEISGDGLVLKKVRGGNYNRLASGAEKMGTGVHEWEVEMTAGATANKSITMYVGVVRDGLDVEKGNHFKQGNGWFLRPDDGSLYGAGLDLGSGGQGQGAFTCGDRVGVRLDLGDGTLQFFKNGIAFGAGFSAGTIAGEVVMAVELVCPGQSVTLKQGGALG